MAANERGRRLAASRTCSMNLINKILVPFDGSPQSAEAVGYAADLARRYDAELTLLYVDHPLTYATPEGSSQAAHARLANEPRSPGEHAITRARQAALEAGATRVDTITQRGNPAAEILRCASDDDYDLIVMGTRGRRGLARVFLGSIAEEVVRTSRCPVLTVRAPGAN